MTLKYHDLLFDMNYSASHSQPLGMIIRMWVLMLSNITSRKHLTDTYFKYNMYLLVSAYICLQEMVLYKDIP